MIPKPPRVKRVYRQTKKFKDFPSTEDLGLDTLKEDTSSFFLNAVLDQEEKQYDPNRPD